jgi:hypothetical protein
MVSKICFFVLVAIIPYCAFAQEKKDGGGSNKWNKPYDFSYYDMMIGQIRSGGQVYSINATCFWGRARTSLVSYMFPKQPRHKFQVRDIIDIQLGVGKGKDFYANAVIAAGLKIKYDITPRTDFGCNLGYRVGLDRISYSAGMAHGFVRANKFFIEVGVGGNGDARSLSQQRRLANANVKFFFNPAARRKWSINASYWNIQGRNNQLGNQWESLKQYMIGIGFQ